MEQHIPLAERLRPKSLDEYVGQKHLVGPGAVLRNAIESGHVPSMMLWGPPGVGKTQLVEGLALKMEQKQTRFLNDKKILFNVTL